MGDLKTRLRAKRPYHHYPWKRSSFATWVARIGDGDGQAYAIKKVAPAVFEIWSTGFVIGTAHTFDDAKAFAYAHRNKVDYV
jgi:hypothetical protein